MEKAKRKNDTPDFRRYWRFFLPLTIVLGLMVKFPIRILIGESLCDVLFYGAISLMCFATAIRLYQRFGKVARRVTVVIVLCSLLSSWQIFDLAIRRQNVRFYSTYDEPFHEQWAYYPLSFQRDDISCECVVERYYEFGAIAITVEMQTSTVGIGCRI